MKCAIAVNNMEQEIIKEGNLVKVVSTKTEEVVYTKDTIENHLTALNQDKKKLLEAIAQIDEKISFYEELQDKLEE